MLCKGQNRVACQTSIEVVYSSQESSNSGARYLRGSLADLYCRDCAVEPAQFLAHHRVTTYSVMKPFSVLVRA